MLKWFLSLRMKVKGYYMTHDYVKEVVKRSFKLFCISVRCMGVEFMDIVVYRNSISIASTLHYGISEQLKCCVLLQGGRGRDIVVS